MPARTRCWPIWSGCAEGAPSAPGGTAACAVAHLSARRERYGQRVGSDGVYDPLAVTPQVSTRVTVEFAGKLGVICSPVLCSAAMVRVPGQLAPLRKSLTANLTAMDLE